MRLTCTAAVLNLLTAARDLLTGGENGLPAIFALRPSEALCGLLVDEKLAALDTDTTEDFHHHLEELDVVNGTGHLEMTEMAGTAVIIETTGATEFAVLQYTHARIGQAADFAFLCAVTGDFDDGATHNLIRAEDTELYANNRFGL